MKDAKSIEYYITKRGLCSGCGMCKSIFENKVEFKKKESGYYRPVFSEELSKQEIERLLYICPSLNMKYYNDSFENASLFGQAVAYKIGWAASKNIRYEGSSGGGVTAFLVALLEQKKIEAVVHVKRFRDQLEAYGGVSKHIDEVRANVGSLYMPVALLENFSHLIDKFDRVAVVGKGCDIRAVRRFVELNPEYKNKIVVYIGILCGGTPSSKGTDRILDIFNIKKKDVKEFRYRGHGWPGYCTAITGKYDIKQMTYNEAWAKYLGPTSPFVCKICFDGIADAADIVFGDAWKCVDGKYPSFEETDGRNLIICRNETGLKLLNDACNGNYIVLSDEKIDCDSLKLIQPSQASRRYLAKYKFWGLRLAGLIFPIVDLKYLTKISILSEEKLSIVMKIRTIMGSIKRALKKEE